MMHRDETKYCEECKRCEQIVNQRADSYYIQCKLKSLVFDDPIVYCKYKK